MLNSVFTYKQQALLTVHFIQPHDTFRDWNSKVIIFSINKFDINCYRKAVSNKDGIGEFYDDDEEHQCSVIINLDRSDEKHLHRVEVETVKLDSFIEDNNIQKIDLIKMDVETHESEVIDGFSSHLVHYKPSMIVEIIRDFTASHLQDKLSNLGYNYFYINESTPQNVKD